MNWVLESYGTIFFTVIEIDIKDFGGVFPRYKYEKMGDIDPFTWFNNIRSKDFIPRWEKVGERDLKE